MEAGWLLRRNGAMRRSCGLETASRIDSEPFELYTWSLFAQVVVLALSVTRRAIAIWRKKSNFSNEKERESSEVRERYFAPTTG